MHRYYIDMGAHRPGKRFTAEKIINMLREAEVLLSSGKTAGEVCRELNISEQTCYRWRKEYGGMRVAQATGEGDSEAESTCSRPIA
ncbi:MAG: transposase [Spirochaetota bacterium]|nr:MAG: transposase [Spirochaetota bacterium]